MIKHNQDGAVSGLAISLVFTVLLLIGAIAFGGWAFMSRADYKSNTDSKIEDAVIIAKQQEGSAKDAQFLQDEKKPLRTYKGPEAYGSLEINYPKTWSGYIDDKGKSSSALVDGYFNPSVVPSITDETSVFALRIQVLSQQYSQVLSTVKSSTTNGSTAPPTISPYALPKVPGTVGIKVSGTLPNGKQGTMIVLPLRSQTLEVWAETSQFTPDFEASILPNFSFIP
ncbi:MAG: hypothetical protein JWO35_188 [Candidatus Saccharibacteria bacterium]|nr:hypothetical protein [Candidatus Saccharibacteria bacterium]